jgi:TolB-like protein/DNA-binding winged helix-turn-helix (wHTH) protein/tetratricopeptide (TPR) repeat protein
MESPVQTRRMRFGVFVVDLRSGEVRKHGIRLKLQDQPFQVLALLLEHPGEVVTREELRQKLWPADTFVDFDTGLNSAIKKLRDVLGDSAGEPRYIETLPRRGYRLTAPVHSVVAAFPLTASKVTAHAIQIHPSEIGRTKISDADCSEESSLPTSSHPRGGFVQPNTIESFTPPLATVAKTRRLQMTVGFALAITLAALALGARLLVSAGRASRNLSAPIRSIAVLPLENLTGDPSQEYFSDGMTDALITELAQVRGLTVISRTSAMHYKGTKKTLPEIARELNVDGVVEGTVVRNDDEVKITAQLIRASTDTHLWTATYARVQQDILRLQAEVAREVTHQISGQLVPVDNTAESRPAVNPEAYDAYLKGLFYWNKESPDGVRTAIRYFKRAIEKDPNFAAAYSRLASCYASLAFMSEMPSNDAYAAAKEAADKAVALDDNLDHVHTALAWIALSDWNWTRAETEYKRALQLNPNSVNAHIGYFYFFLICGKLEEAAREERAATASDPLSIHTLSVGLSSAYHRRQYDEGLAKARTAIELYPQVSVFHVLLSNFYAAKGEGALSAQEILLAEETSGAPPERLAALRAANAMAGPKGLRRKRIELNKKVEAKQSMTAYDIAIDCAAVGDSDQALVWLETALRAHDSKISLIAVEPIFDNIRSDPRFVGLLHQMGLKPARS